MLPPPKLIAVDVDGTLIRNGSANAAVVDWLRKKNAEGFEMMLWSMRGGSYAKKTAAALGLEGLFGTIISKPGYVLDDKGWSWIRGTKIITNLK